MGLDLTGVDLATETVSTPRLLLRPWSAADADDIFRACQDEAIQGWVTALPSPYGLADAREFVSDLGRKERLAGTGMQCAVVERVSGRLAGSIGLMRLGAMTGPEIGYWIAAWSRGHGYAAEGTDALAGWAFEHGLHRVMLLAAPANVASCRSAERAGFRREGLVREAELDRAGRYRDLVLFGRLATDAATGPAG